MKLKLMPFFAGVLTLALVAAPLAAQACNGADKNKNAPESNLPEQTQSSVTVEQTTFAS